MITTGVNGAQAGQRSWSSTGGTFLLWGKRKGGKMGSEVGKGTAEIGKGAQEFLCVRLHFLCEVGRQAVC